MEDKSKARYRDLYVGIDLGTSAVKMILMSENAEIISSVSREYPISFPAPGWAEQNPCDWFSAVIQGLEKLFLGVEKDKVRGISFGGQMHGLVILDKDDRVIRPAILWNDGRSVKETEYLNEVIGRERIAQYTGNIAFAGFTAPKVLWLKENEPENFARISRIMLPKDYIAYRLTGVFCTDYSDASGMLLLDVENKCWSKEMMEICHVREDQLPVLYESWEPVGTLKKEIADKLGISCDVQVTAGAGDNAAAAIGTGTVGEGGCNLSLGTSGTLFISSSRFAADENFALHSFAHADGGYHLMGCMLSAASCNKWWMDTVLEDVNYGGIQEKMTALGENSVYFLPYLMGERSPHNDPAARAAFIGMSMDTSRVQMTQAVLEGVAFGLRDSMEVARKLGAAPQKTTICGGGAKSPVWREIVASVLNMEVEVPVCDEGPAFGAAILAAVGCKAFDSVEQAAKMLVKMRKKETPDPILVGKYEKKYRKYQQLYPALKNVYDGM